MRERVMLHWLVQALLSVSLLLLSASNTCVVHHMSFQQCHAEHDVTWCYSAHCRSITHLSACWRTLLALSTLSFSRC